ncbi:DUF4192 domain-containing protein [Nocardia sp. XZ_19_385]|uniref:DUF4192 domain-containing protein n=1 Tax=Nocardia sp. XZ_19_385 TaxID=2769488 RepID=UPI00188FD5F4|nr:DUF4192 domain-containing protein [Nocardia sp. XZ_19_385]
MPPSARTLDPVALITALPATLGRTPHRSVVFALLASDEAGAPTVMVGAVRFDIDIDIAIRGRLADSEIAVELERLSAGPGSAGVVAVIVDDRVSATHGRARDKRRQRRMLDRLRHRLAGTPVRVLSWWAVTAIVEGAPWHSLDCPQCHGRLPAPPVARATSAGESLEPDPALRRRVSAAMPGAIAADHRLRGAAEQPGDRVLTALVLRVFELLRRSAVHDLSPDQLAELGIALRYPQVSAVMKALPLYPCAQTAEQMWMLLTRALPEPYRAEPAALLGFSLYARAGSHALARRALDIALGTEPDHRFARTISRALGTTTPSVPLRSVVWDGIADAIRLRIDLAAQATIPEVQP